MASIRFYLHLKIHIFLDRLREAHAFVRASSAAWSQILICKLVAPWSRFEHYREQPVIWLVDCNREGLQSYWPLMRAHDLCHVGLIPCFWKTIFIQWKKNSQKFHKNRDEIFAANITNVPRSRKFLKFLWTFVNNREIFSSYYFRGRYNINRSLYFWTEKDQFLTKEIFDKIHQKF